MEMSHFLGDWWFFMWFLVILLVGTGEPPPYCNKNTLGKIGSKFGIGRPPPPQLGQKPNFFQKSNLWAPLSKPNLANFFEGNIFLGGIGRLNIAKGTDIYLLYSFSTFAISNRNSTDWCVDFKISKWHWHFPIVHLTINLNTFLLCTQRNTETWKVFSM